MTRPATADPTSCRWPSRPPGPVRTDGHRLRRLQPSDAASPSATPCWTPASPPGTPNACRTRCGRSATSAGATRAPRPKDGLVPAEASATWTAPAGIPRAQCLLGAASEVFTSFADAADQAGWSRRYGGIHFEDGDLKGRTLGHQVGTAVWARTVTSFNGTAIAPPPRPPRSRPPPTAAPTTHGGAHHHRGADHDDRGTNDHH
jgi:hypothetical protein